ncbi:hypothetical protein FB388_2065 [Pseudonocardia cypriaca]|uniref:Uncharacterized protein n=1 Tax=Pseudonocardia cypriaca TaxID=882449 RepID=A0A543GF54_9PSEU|nr:hypothetical protein FB388_2065 [Pseudonocardia cypriaca]
MRVLGWLAAAGTLPYLTLKLTWLSGGTAGMTDPALLAEPAIVVGNAVTFAMDLVVIVLALALTHRWGDRLPVWLVLLPMWVGTGFLVPMAISIMPAITVETLTGGARSVAFEPWLQPLVYGGFAWQGVFLCVAFGAHAARRWSGLVTAVEPPAPGLVPFLRVVTAGGCVMAGASALLHLVVGLTAGSAVALGVEAVNAALAIAGAAGVAALVRTRPVSRWAAVAAAWTGSAAMFAWGLYTVTVGMTTTALGGGSDAAAGGAQLTGLLGGFALAVAGMLALVGAGESRSA